jgi:hypothetical protein
MSTDTIKTIAIGLISVPTRPTFHEALLTTALQAAIAAYSALRPLRQAVTYTNLAEDVPAAGTPGVDEDGAYLLYTIPLTTGIHYATEVTIAGDNYKFRLISISSTDATIKIYIPDLIGDPAAADVTIWRPVAHSPDVMTWPAHHEIIIAFMCASFYLNAQSLLGSNFQWSEMIQQLAASYYGRASATLTQTAQSEAAK